LFTKRTVGHILSDYTGNAVTLVRLRIEKFSTLPT